MKDSSKRYGAALTARRLCGVTGLVFLGALVPACSSQPQIPFSYSLEPLSFEPGNTYKVTDGRARFREIFCAANEDHGEALPDYTPCEEALVRFDDEPEPCLLYTSPSPRD